MVRHRLPSAALTARRVLGLQAMTPNQQQAPKAPRWSRVTTVLAALAVVAAGTTVWAKGTKIKQAIHVKSQDAEYKELLPGITQRVLYGNPTKAAYGAFTKFAPGQRNDLHVHSNDIRIVVLSGAYIYTPEKGESVRVGPGEFLLVPAGARHVSEADPSDGGLFYEEAAGKFDIKFVKAMAAR